MEGKLICISCPRGCELLVQTDERTGAFISVEGNACIRGSSFAEAEVNHPERMMTSVVSIRGAKHCMLPVISRRPLPKVKLVEAVRAMRSITVEAPIREGDVIAEDIVSTGIDVVAARSLSCRCD